VAELIQNARIVVGTKLTLAVGCRDGLLFLLHNNKTMLASVLAPFGSFVRTLMQRRRPRPLVHILFYVGYAPGSTAVYDVLIEHVVLPLNLLLFTDISTFRVTRVNYVEDLTENLDKSKTTPSNPPVLDLYAYTYIYLLRKQRAKQYPDHLLASITREVNRTTARCREDGVGTKYAIITYSLGMFVYQECLDKLSDTVRDNIVYEGHIGPPTKLEPFFLTKPTGITKPHHICTEFDIFYQPIESNIDPMVDVTDLWHYSLFQYITRLIPHLVLWADPIGWYNIVTRLTHRLG